MIRQRVFCPPFARVQSANQREHSAWSESRRILLHIANSVLLQRLRLEGEFAACNHFDPASARIAAAHYFSLQSPGYYKQYSRGGERDRYVTHGVDTYIHLRSIILVLVACAPLNKTPVSCIRTWCSALADSDPQQFGDWIGGGLATLRVT